MLTTICMWTCKLLETIYCLGFNTPEQHLKVTFYNRADTITIKKKSQTTNGVSLTITFISSKKMKMKNRHRARKHTVPTFIKEAGSTSGKLRRNMRLSDHSEYWLIRFQVQCFCNLCWNAKIPFLWNASLNHFLTSFTFILADIRWKISLVRKPWSPDVTHWQILKSWFWQVCFQTCLLSQQNPAMAEGARGS